MRNTQTILGLIRERGRKGLPLERVYRLLFNRDLYLTAYGRIYRNAGAMTKGATEETVEGMSLQKIDAIIDAVRQERYRWTPVRRVYIEKRRSTKKRPLGLPSWSDKLLQEVIRLILEGYYDLVSAHNRMGSDRNVDATQHCERFTRPGLGWCGSSREISPSASPVWITPSC